MVGSSYLFGRASERLALHADYSHLIMSDDNIRREASVRGAATNTDRAAAALITDLKERGLLDSTLVIWGGEFGRTPTAQATTGVPGRDHNGKSMMAWMAGGGVKGGTVRKVIPERQPACWHASRRETKREANLVNPIQVVPHQLPQRPHRPRIVGS